MVDRTYPGAGADGLADKALFRVRAWLRSLRLAYWFRTARYILHFGPWQVVPRWFIRGCRPARFDSASVIATSALPSVDAAAVAQQLRSESIAIVGLLVPDVRQRLCELARELPLGEYQLIHSVDDDVQRLVEDPAVLEVLRRYFRSEPVLLECSIVVSDDSRRPRRHEQTYFHLDFAGWESLNLFVYLSDVDADGPCHMIARGSHREVRLGDLVRPALAEGEAEQRFGARIQRITGKAGTIFFENTEAFHCRQPGGGRRVMLNLLFASHRGWFSRGRVSQEQLQHRLRVVDRVKADMAAAANEAATAT